ncbi:hypothetical protein RCO48_22895 [Peribacillus frigoritolerans]|nr:hypothetical protein [Peribacillus frigoritolerans]
MKKEQAVNRMKIQTSTTAENKKEDNILLDLVFTTIVAKGQASLEWEPIKGIKEYTIYRNGVDIGKVSGCSFNDRSIGEDQEYTYTIKAKTAPSAFRAGVLCREIPCSEYCRSRKERFIPSKGGDRGNNEYQKR